MRAFQRAMAKYGDSANPTGAASVVSSVTPVPKRSGRRLAGLAAVMLMVAVGTLAADVGVASANTSCIQWSSTEQLHCYSYAIWAPSPWLTGVSDTTWFSYLCEPSSLHHEFVLDDLWIGTAGNTDVVHQWVELFAASGGPLAHQDSWFSDPKPPWWGWADQRPSGDYYSHLILTAFDRPQFDTDYDRWIQYGNNGDDRWDLYLAHGGTGAWALVGSSYPNPGPSGAVESGVEHYGSNSDTSVFWVNNKNLAWNDGTWHNAWDSATWGQKVGWYATPNTGYLGQLSAAADQYTASSWQPQNTNCGPHG